jgi:hypothetical protein
LLLQDLAHIAGLADPADLVDHGRVKIGLLDALLVHDPAYDDGLLQVRIRMGAFSPRDVEMTRSVLEANYTNGYGGECVFSLLPGTDDLVVTLRMRLDEKLSVHELWRHLSDISRNASVIWENVVADGT